MLYVYIYKIMLLTKILICTHIRWGI